MAPALVVVTGPPGAGKTTIAAALREGLGLPLVAKDALKETLGAALAVTDREASHRLGGAVFDALHDLVRELLAHGVSLIVEGNFTPGWGFDELPPARIVQVHVTAAPETLRARLLDRDASRHPVHYDAEAADEIFERARRGEWAPLPLAAPLIEVDTTAWPGIRDVVAATATALA